MKFTLQKASDDDFEEIIEINTLEELLKLRDTCGEPLIIRFEREGIRELVIYDDYLE